MIVLQSDQRRIGPAIHRCGETCQSLGLRSLIHDGDVARHARLTQRGVDRGDGFVNAVERQNHNVGVISVA